MNEKSSIFSRIKKAFLPASADVEGTDNTPSPNTGESLSQQEEEGSSKEQIEFPETYMYLYMFWYI